MKSLSYFRRQYPLQPVRDYTFLGTERSVDKPIVRFDGGIELWFEPADHIPWIRKSVEAGGFDVGLVDDYLPALRYVYRNPESSETCEMTAFAADRDPVGAIHLYVRLVERAAGTCKTRCFRLRDRATIRQEQFKIELRKLRDHWTRFFERGASVTADDPTVLHACKASIIRALITFTGRHPHYGVRAYGEVRDDGFPPTVISLANCLLDWGHAEPARDNLLYYFGRFVTDTGRFDYYGPSLAEYGQMLSLIRRLADETDRHEWLEVIRPKIERMADWLWSEQSSSEDGLIAGVPEADTREEIDVYFHNNAWCWRGLRDIASVLQRPDDEGRCSAYRRAILRAIEQVTDTRSEPAFIPPVARKIEPFKTMTQDVFASYTNYRYWPELLSSGILPRERMEAIIQYRISHAGEVAGMTGFKDRADDWPIAEYAAALLNMGRLDEVRDLLFSHLAGHHTPETWTAYEQVSLDGEPYRRAVADYCVPAQLVAPRVLAWLSQADLRRRRV